jgi:hypothetical protein
VHAPLDVPTLQLMIKAVNFVRSVNKDKANFLVFAILIQLLAILMLGATVLAVVV